MRWLDSGHDTCRRTQQKLVNKSLIPNHNLRSLIAKWCEANGLEQPKRSGQVSSNATAESQLTAYEQAQVVNELLKELSSQNVVHQRGAAGMLRQLAKPEYRASIGDSGGIPFLVSMLATDDVSTQEDVVATLLNVSIADENKIRLVRSGAIPAIVYVLESGSMVARENTAAALFSLSKLEENRVIIGAAGSIPPLILLLRTGSRPGKKHAAEALFYVCNCQGNKNKSIAIRAGLVPILLELLVWTENGLVDVAVSILDVLSSHPEGRAAISAAAAIPSLVAVIRNESPRNKENAAAILVHLCNGRGAQQQQSRIEAQEHGLV